MSTNIKNMKKALTNSTKYYCAIQCKLVNSLLKEFAYSVRFSTI